MNINRKLNYWKNGWQGGRTVAGTQKLHCFIPVSANTVEVKLFSSSTVSRREKVEVGRTPVLSPRATAIGGYVTVAYDGESWLGCVVGAHETEHAITVKFLHPCIPAPCFVFPEQEDLLDIDLSLVSMRPLQQVEHIL